VTAAPSATAIRSRAKSQESAGSARLRPWRNPWRRPWFLEGFTWLYLVWSLAPIAIAVLFSFNKGKSQSTYQGLSMRWYYGDPVNSVWHNPQLHSAVFVTLELSAYTTLIAVPIGVAFALGINRWRGYVPMTFNFVMILSFVVPELIFGVAMFFVFTQLFSGIGLGTLAEVLGLVTWNVSWPAIIVQARLVTIGRQYEEASADLGYHHAGDVVHRRHGRISRLPVDDPRRADRRPAGPGDDRRRRLGRRRLGQSRPGESRPGQRSQRRPKPAFSSG
jgi:ABC-type Fe3+ transport system permease subunit